MSLTNMKEQLERAQAEYDANQKPVYVKPAFYTQCFITLKEICKRHGYNLLINGSMNRDLDLIAVPWADDCSDHLKMMEECRDWLGGTFNHVPNNMPGGRIGYVINLNRGGKETNYEDPQWYLDIAVYPVSPATPQPAQGEGKPHSDEANNLRDAAMNVIASSIDYYKNAEGEWLSNIGPDGNPVYLVPSDMMESLQEACEEFAASLPSQSGKAIAGVWVKASERLPDHMYEQDVFYKWNGKRSDGWVGYENGIPVFYYNDGGVWLPTENLQPLEWWDGESSGKQVGEPSRQPIQQGPVWVKASERMPAPGTSVIIKTEGYTGLARCNYETPPEFYYETETEGLITRDCEWLDASGSLPGFSEEQVREAVIHVLPIDIGKMFDKTPLYISDIANKIINQIRNQKK